MEENFNAPGLAGLVEKNYALIKRMELISFVIFVIGFLLYELNVAHSNIVLIVGTIATAISLFLQGFKMIEFEDLKSYNLLGGISFINFLYKLYFFSLSVSLMSLLGFVKEFKKGNTAAIVGGSTLIIILILTFLSKIQDKSKVYDLKFYTRIFICLLFLTILTIEKGVIK
jgi:hypothetical protein